MQELTGFFSRAVRQIFLQGTVFYQGFQLEDVFIKGCVLLDAAQRIEEQVQVDPAPEGFFITFGKTFLCWRTSLPGRTPAYA